MHHNKKTPPPRSSLLTHTFFILLAVLFVCHNLGHAQIGLGGFSAVLTVPTARTLPDGVVAAGLGFIPKPYAVFGGDEYNNLAYFATIGFLPGLEISLRATRAQDYYLASIGDRMASVRLRGLPETRFTPAVTLGLHDVIAIQGEEGWFNALYLVATKEVKMHKHFNCEATFGYGVDWISARAHEFAGKFGGLSFGVAGVLFLKSEYDTQRFNYGAGVRVKSLLTAQVMFIAGKKDHAAFGLTLQHRLLRN